MLPVYRDTVRVKGFRLGLNPVYTSLSSCMSLLCGAYRQVVGLIPVGHSFKSWIR